jgi:YidC/Oxa1 family membrane protein insertase
MEPRRFLLLAALGLVLLMIWQAWLERQQPTQVPGETPSAASRPAPGADLPPDAPASATPGDVPQAPATPATAPAPVQDQPETRPAGAQRIRVTTDLLRVELDTLGGGPRRVELLTYPVAVDEPDNPVALFHQDGGDLLFAQSGLIARDRELPNHRTVYRAEQQSYTLQPGADRLEVPLHWSGPDGVEYSKVLVFERDSYVIGIEYRVRNTTDSPWEGYFYGQFLSRPLEEKGGFMLAPRNLSYVGGAVYTPADKYRKISFDDIRDGEPPVTTDSGWVAMLQHYFVSAWLPEPQTGLQFYSRDLDGRYNLGYKTTTPLVLAPGEQGVLRTRLYTGPKEHDRLEQLAEGMVLTVDYGWLTPVAAPLFWILDWIHGVVRNWGWAIILLTVLIKLVFYPLSAASYKSMARMRALQPRMKTLKERYGDDRQKFNQAMMELYKTEKVNPMGGCLPIAVQIPVFIALYWVLIESVEMRQAPFALWLQDLSSPDPFFVLPIIMGVSMLVQQLISPAPMDPMQKKIMMALPIVFTGFFLLFPAGLVLYWTVNNILSIAQQWRINQVIGAKK